MGEEHPCFLVKGTGLVGPPQRAWQPGPVAGAPCYECHAAPSGRKQVCDDKSHILSLVSRTFKQMLSLLTINILWLEGVLENAVELFWLRNLEFNFSPDVKRHV